MKKIIVLVLLTLLVGVAAAAEEQAEARKLGWIDRFFERFSPEPYYISGGTFSETGDVSLGDTLDVTLYLQFTQSSIGASPEGYTYKVEIYFIDETNPSHQKKISTYYFKSQRKSGDYIQAKVTNVRTEGRLDSSFCSKGVKVAGKHYVWQSSLAQKDGGAWILDSKIVTDPALGRDYSYDFTSEKTNANFKLVCAGTNDPCPKKDNGYVCRYEDERFMAIQNGYVDSDGSCKVSYDKVPCPSGMVCQGDGECVYKERCGSGDKRCNLNGKVSEVCSNNAWKMVNACSETGKCEDGECVTAETDKETSNAGTGDNEEDSYSTGDVESECDEDVLCGDGETVFLKCVSGSYEEGDDCPGGDTPDAATGTGTKNSGSGIRERGTGTTDKSDWGESDNYFDPATAQGKTLIAAAAGLVLGTFTFFVFRKPARKRGNRTGRR